VPAGAERPGGGAAAAGEEAVVSAYPVLIDQDGYRKYVVGHELTVRFREGLDDTACRSILASMGARWPRTTGLPATTRSPSPRG